MQAAGPETQGGSIRADGVRARADALESSGPVRHPYGRCTPRRSAAFRLQLRGGPASTFLLTTLTALLAALALTAAPALAAEAVLGFEAPTTFGEFSFPRGAAVDNGSGTSKGDVYIADAEHHPGRVVKFDADGTTQLAELTYTPTPTEEAEGKKPLGVVFWDAVDPSTGDVYASNQGGGAVTKFSPEGAFISQITEASVAAAPAHAGFAPGGVAVDGSGKLYVADQANAVVDRLSSAGVYETQFADEATTAVTTIALDTSAGPNSGDLYVTDFGVAVKAFNAAAGTPVTPAGCASNVIDTAEPLGVAVDPLDGAVVVEEGGFAPTSHLMRYQTPCGPTPIEFGKEKFNEGSDGIAVSAIAPHAHDVYAVSNSGTIANLFHAEVGTPPPPPEVPKTDPASELTPTTAKLNGELLGGESRFFFAYGAGPSCTGASQTPLTKAEGVAPESALVEGLLPSTLYRVCLVAQNRSGNSTGNEVQFTTPGLVPLIQSEASSGVAASEATLKAEINPENQLTTCEFEYADDTAFKAEEWAKAEKAKCEQTLEGLSVLPATATVTGLQEGTLYHFRVTASNETGTSPEREGSTFTTKGSGVPIVTEEHASGETPFAATIGATVNPGNQKTTCKVEYSASPLTGLDPTAPCPAELEAGETGVPVSIAITGLSPNATYHYRVIAENQKSKEAGEPSRGEELEFKTLEAFKPTIEGEKASAITQTEATIEANVGPDFQTAECHVSYLPEGAEDPLLVPCEPETVPAGASPVAIQAKLTALAPGSTVEYKVIAKNETGETSGADHAFSTHPKPPVAVTGEASAVSSTVATLNGTVNPEGEGAAANTTYYFEYGTTAAYGSFAPVPPPGTDIGTGTSAKAENAPLSGLEPSSEYHYRLVAVNDSGGQLAPGEDRTFSTLANPPESLGPVSTTPTGVLLAMTATATPGTSYVIEYGTETGTYPFSAPIPPGEGEAGESEILTVQLEGLQRNTTYYYRLNATNGFATTTGGEEQFKTSDGAGPEPEPPPGFSLVGTPPAAPLTSPFADMTGLAPIPPPKPPPVKPKVLTKAQKLALALTACRKKHNRHRRSACERQARKQYAPAATHGKEKRP